MAREKKIDIGAINITIQPHTPFRYVELFRYVAKLRLIKPIQGDTCGILISANYIDKKQGDTSPLTGDICRFTEIPADGEWLNTETFEKADEEDLSAVSIPEKLKPNLTRFSYVFFPEHHLLIFETYFNGNALASRSAVKLIERIFSDEKVINKFGKVEVTQIPCVDELKKALAMFRLERLELQITRPNPDDHADAEREVLARMNAMNIEEQKQSFKAVHGDKINVDKDLKSMAIVAARNGHVVAKGKNKQLKPEFFSTTQHPWSDRVYYDPAVESAFDIFVAKAVQAKNDIISWFKRA